MYFDTLLNIYNKYYEICALKHYEICILKYCEIYAFKYYEIGYII